MEEDFKLYRCLRASRLIDGEREHDECAEIISRNPNVDFSPGLVGVEVDHKIYANTLWDRDLENYPRQYLEEYRGRLGHILVSCFHIWACHLMSGYGIGITHPVFINQIGW